MIAGKSGRKPATASAPRRISGRRGGAASRSDRKPSRAIRQAFRPEIRTSPRTPGPGGLATAAIVSSESRSASTGRWLQRVRYESDSYGPPQFGPGASSGGSRCPSRSVDKVRGVPRRPPMRADTIPDFEGTRGGTGSRARPVPRAGWFCPGVRDSQRFPVGNRRGLMKQSEIRTPGDSVAAGSRGPAMTLYEGSRLVLQLGLSEDALVGADRQFIGEASGYGNLAWFDGMLELAMTPFLGHQSPAVSFQDVNEFPDSDRHLRQFSDAPSTTVLFPPRPRPGLAPVAIAAIVGVGLALFRLAVPLLDHLAIGRVLASLVEDLFHEQAEGARRLPRRRRTVAAGASLAAWARAAPAHVDLIVGRLLGGRVSDLGQEQALADRPQAAGDEVDAQAGGDLVEHECHENHHVLHGLLLHFRLRGGRRRSEELGLEEHEPDDHDGQQIEPVAQEHDLDRKPEEHVRGCEVIDPEERRVPESHAGVQGLPEPHEYRQLDQGRNAAADRIDA